MYIGIIGMVENTQQVSEKIFGLSADSFATICITILGFVVTYFMTRKNLKDEVLKFKKTTTIEAIQTLSFDLCDLMHNMKTNPKDSQNAKKYAYTMNKILAYGSCEANRIAVWAQQINYENTSQGRTDWRPLVALGLLISQLKYDFTSEAISAETWFLLRITDYQESGAQEQVRQIIDTAITELKLNPEFRCKRGKQGVPII